MNHISTILLPSHKKAAHTSDFVQADFSFFNHSAR